MTQILRGVIRGRTIELENDTGLTDGHKVEVYLRTRQLPGPPPGWQPHSRETAAGMLSSSSSTEDDRILEGIYQQRKEESPRGIPE